MKRLFSFLRPRTQARDRESDGEAFSLPPPEPMAAAPPGTYDGAGERRILLDMRDRQWEDTAARLLREGSPPFATCVRRGETELDRLCREEPPDVYFTEVTAHTPYTAEERLTRAAFVKARAPDCKAVFCIDENTYPALARTVLGLKREGRIDQFVFSSISRTYLSAVMDTL